MDMCDQLLEGVNHARSKSKRSTCSMLHRQHVPGEVDGIGGVAGDDICVNCDK